MKSKWSSMLLWGSAILAGLLLIINMFMPEKELLIAASIAFGFNLVLSAYYVIYASIAHFQAVSKPVARKDRPKRSI